MRQLTGGTITVLQTPQNQQQQNPHKTISMNLQRKEYDEWGFREEGMQYNEQEVRE